MNYQEIKLFHSYLYNKVNYREFKAALEDQIEGVSESYIMGKWTQFNRNKVQFVIRYNEKLFNYFCNKIKSENYKG